ncbi:beta-ketoacyl synthase [Pseudonocardia xinjiangensis]|uniref:Beta-ketoacyl synthase n=1 Tax=Pseudonocardia xinjiangensis TaxID=75289 RepID=A0ABX1R9D0_9PSEU|nr:beta-ketoacyl synthase [Pseudonocardia xinjiangensis]NMH75833.1 beta-ketoacyl synthase [Pseudonocardia xinjiangensis]
MTAELDVLSFDGRPFDALAALQPVAPHPQEPDDRAPQGVPEPTTSDPSTHDRSTHDPVALAVGIVAELRAELLAAHRAAMDVQVRWQERALAALAGPATPAAPGAGEWTPAALLAAVADQLGDGPGRGGGPLRLALAWDGDLPRHGEQVQVTRTPSGALVRAGERPVLRVDGPTAPAVPAPAPALAAAPAAFRPEGALEPLAATLVDHLAPAEIDLLVAGRAGAVFGARHDQQAPRLAAGLLRAVTELRPGGPAGVGVLRGPCAVPAGDTDVVAAAWQAGSVLALWLGLHLCVPEARFQPVGTCGAELFDTTGAPDAEVVAEITGADLVPRPWLRLDAEIRAGERVLARVSGLTVALREPPGVPMGTRSGGRPPVRPVRRGITGDLAVVDELALATASVGDLGPALGPEFARYAERRATRPPAGGLRLVGRVMAVQGTRGELSGGATGETEFDSPADAWYYGAAPSPAVPNVVLMETSLQSALLLGYHLGATLVDPEQDYSLRNLDGSATLHREVELRGRTIRQRSTLLSTTVLSGAVLQGFRYALWLDGEDRDTVDPFYSGQSLFGFFTAAALANQTGLDNGASVPNWLEERPGTPVRVVDVDTGASGPLHLVDRIEVVDGGGRHGAGYLRAVRPVEEGDWFFARHFHLDPVMPGSLGIEAVVQALQQWLLDTGATAGLDHPEFVVPAGVELTWRYRGQILAGDGAMTLEVHVREVQRRPGRVRVIADASLWKPGLRIYELDGIAAEAREKGAQPW